MFQLHCFFVLINPLCIFSYIWKNIKWRNKDDSVDKVIKMKFLKQENFNFIKKHTTMKTLADVSKQDHTTQKDNLNQTIVYSQQFPLTPNLITTFCSPQIIDING